MRSSDTVRGESPKSEEAAMQEEEEKMAAVMGVKPCLPALDEIVEEALAVSLRPTQVVVKENSFRSVFSRLAI